MEREIKTLPLPQIPEISLTSFPTSSLEWLNIISVAGGFMTLFLGTMKDSAGIAQTLCCSYPCSHLCRCMLFYSK